MRVLVAGLTAAGFNRVGGGIRGPVGGLTQGPGPGPGAFTSGATRSASTWAAAVAGIEVSGGGGGLRVLDQSQHFQTSWWGYS